MHIAALWPSLFWLWTASEIALVLATRTRRRSGNTQDRGSMYILWLTIVASITACDWLAAILPMGIINGSPWLKPLTVALMITGLAIRWTAILSLGRSFSVNVAIKESQTIYRKGLFRFVRHPSYLGMLVIFLAVGLRSRNLVGLAIMLICPAAALLYRIHIEERALQAAFGADYTRYQQTTKRLIPGLF